MENEKYNGWTNYETWNVALHIDNDESSQNYWQETAQEIYDRCFDNADASSTLTVDEHARLELADSLKDYHDEFMPELQGAYCDLLTAALSDVNWQEIAASILADLAD